MRSFVFLAMAFFCIQASVGEPFVCPIRGDLTNGVKCGDKVYTRNQELVDVLKGCTAGKKGQPANMEIVRCMLGEYQAVKGSLPLDNVMRDLSKEFGVYEDQIYAGTKSCYEEFKDEPSESSKLLECWSDMSVRVCGVKTCNWLNNNV